MSVQEKTIKQTLEEKELEQLSLNAAKSIHSKGRKYPEKSCTLRTEFQRDRDRILHSKAFRRLKHKTQVFFSPTNDHFRTRMTHTLEVSQIARTIAKALNLNEDLTEAIALGHDLGHTPFGHSGECALNEVMAEGYKHNEQSIRVAENIEELNLTFETLDGILKHSWEMPAPYTLEGQIVKISDKIAYINHDIQDSIRAEIIAEKDLPQDCIKYFSNYRSERLSKMVHDIVDNSINKTQISMSEECFYYLEKLRSWMFTNVYYSPLAKDDEEKIKKLIKQLFEYYCSILKKEYNGSDILVQRTAADYVSGMTDRYLLTKYKEVFNKEFIPKTINIDHHDHFLHKLAQMNGLS